MPETQWAKIVSLACKAKHAPPKAKYVDSIVSATFANDGSLQDICRALHGRLRDTSGTIVMKALIVVHSLVRQGSPEHVMPYLSGSKVLGLEAVIAHHDASSNIHKLATYLDRRIRTYGALKYDIARDKSDRRGEKDGIRGCNRLRTLSVDKGLLRETTLLQKLMDSLAECKFYLDDIEDDVVMTSLRMLVKDLLMLFVAVNEGVINVLEHYFEMSQPDGQTALKIYKRFCGETERVVTYLGVAKKLQNVINVAIPNLRHAPVSLAGSLEEYLNDPNFEHNRAEYKTNRLIAEGKAPAKGACVSCADLTHAAPSPTPAKSSSEATAKPKTPPPAQAAIQDFFASIEAEQPHMFNPNTGSPTNAYFQQQAQYNPFGAARQLDYGQQPQSMVAQPTGAFMQAQPTGAFMQPQPTGAFMQQPQPTGAFMQPQATGAFAQFAPPPQPSMSPNPFLQPQPTGAFGQAPPQQLQQQFTGFAFGGIRSSPQPQPQLSIQTSQPANPFRQSVMGGQLASAASPFAPPSASRSPAPISAQPTGSRNPFAPAPGSEPPRQPSLPPGPSLNTLAFASYQQQAPIEEMAPQQQAPPPQQQSQQPRIGGLMADVASSFVTPTNGTATQPPQQQQPQQPPQQQPAPQTNGSAFSPTALAPQRTGFGGSTIKPFQPTSSFGMSMAESLPTVPAATSPTGQPNPFRASTLPTGSTAVSSQPTGFSTPFGMQSTGASSSPFGANAFGQNFSGMPQDSSAAPFGAQPTGAFGNAFGQPQRQQSSLI